MGATRLSDVTLYVPARNAAAWLVACLEAIGRLDPAPAEVIVVYDEASRDETAAIARALPDVIALPQSRPGLTAARNTAFQHARTRWVASVDADVLVAPDWLGALWQAHTLLEQPAALSGRTEERVTQAGDAFRALMMPHHWGAHTMRGPFMTISDALFDRDAVIAVGGYRESLERYGDDSRLSQDLRDAGYALAYTPHARALHIRTDSIASVLDLRWSYSEPRQRARLNDLEGLQQKLAVNVEYGRMAVARALEAQEPLLACIGAVLPWHHALADFRSMLSQRTLLSTDTQTHALEALQRAVLDRVSETATRLTSLCGAVLPNWHVSESVSHAALPWPSLDRYVDAVTETLVAWNAEVAPLLDHVDALDLATPSGETVARWSQLLGGPTDARLAGTDWPAPRSAAPWRPVTAAHARIDEHVNGKQTVALDRFASPLTALSNVVAHVDAVSLSYTLPTRLTAGAEILLAVDLAEACARENLAIVGFKTLAGGVELHAKRGQR